MKYSIRDVTQIALMPRNGINCYVVEDVLIDAGIRGSRHKIIEATKNMNLRLHALTHAHADHQGSSKSICQELNIPMWCSENEKPQAESGDATREYPAPNHLIAKFQRSYWAGEGYTVAKVIKEGDKVGGFTVVDTPGHSSGHISFFREADGFLIVGDVMTNMNLLTTFVGLHEPPGLFTMDKELNRQSIKKIASLKPSVLFFGHGPALYNRGELDVFVRKLRDN